jgi:hypothetical protein
MLEIMFAAVQNILKDKKPEKWNGILGIYFSTVILNMPSCFSVHEFLAANKAALILHSHYLPDCAV